MVSARGHPASRRTPPSEVTQCLCAGGGGGSSAITLGAGQGWESGAEEQSWALARVRSAELMSAGTGVQGRRAACSLNVMGIESLNRHRVGGRCHASGDGLVSLGMAPAGNEDETRRAGMSAMEGDACGSGPCPVACMCVCLCACVCLPRCLGSTCVRCVMPCCLVRARPCASTAQCIQ